MKVKGLHNGKKGSGASNNQEEAAELGNNWIIRVRL